MTLFALTLAICCTAVLGLALGSSTRILGILAVALLCLLFPIPVFLLLLVGGCFYIFIHVL